jgi:hypothetical protein
LLHQEQEGSNERLGNHNVRSQSGKFWHIWEEQTLGVDGLLGMGNIYLLLILLGVGIAYHGMAGED